MYLVNVKSTVKISSTFVAFLESMNFTKCAILRDYKHHRMICNALQPRQKVIKFDFNNLWLAGSFQLFAIRNSKECYIRRHQNKIFTKDIEKCNELCQKMDHKLYKTKIEIEHRCCASELASSSLPSFDGFGSTQAWV